jgi:hypothetical protein
MVNMVRLIDLDCLGFPARKTLVNNQPSKHLNLPSPLFRKSLFINVSEEDSVNLTVNCLQTCFSPEIQRHRSKPSLLSEQFGIELEATLETAFLGFSRRHTGSPAILRLANEIQR